MIKAIQPNPERAAAGVRFNEVLLGIEPEPAIECLPNKIFHLINARARHIHMDLKEVTLPSGVDAHGHTVVPERSIEHRLDQIDECQAAKEVTALEPV